MTLRQRSWLFDRFVHDGRSRVGGQINPERGPFANFAVNLDEATVAFHNRLGGGEPQTGPFAEFLRGKEGFENAVPNCRRDAGAAVLDLHEHVCAGGVSRDA